MEQKKVEKPTIPLIPPSSLSRSQDASAILREVFHDVLEEPTLPANVVENWTRFHVDSETDRKTAFHIHSVKERSKLKNENLQIVEQKLCVNIKQSLEREKIREGDEMEKELKRLTRGSLFPNIDKEDARDYNLITSDDLMASKIMQKLDFTYDVQKPCTPPTKLPKISKSLKPPPKPPLKEPTPKNNPHTKLTKRDLQALCPNTNQKTKEKNLEQKSSLNLINPLNFRLDKTTLTFKNFKINTVYKQRFKLQNVSSNLQKLTLPGLTWKNRGCFRVEPQFDPDTLRLSAGMSAWFVVWFQSDVLMDEEDVYEVMGHQVQLVSFRDPPDLTAFVLRNTWPAKERAPSSFDVHRGHALNFSVECGACFVGEQMTCFLILKNNGGAGRFFMMTEEQWCEQDIDTLHTNGTLDFAEFSITPNFFTLEQNEFIVLKVDVWGAAPTTAIENIMLLSDNITWESIDFIADIIELDKYTVTFDHSELQFTSFANSLKDMHSCDDIWDPPTSDISNLTIPRQSSELDQSRTDHGTSPAPSKNTSYQQQQTQQDAPGAPISATSSVDIIDEVIFDYLLGIEKDDQSKPSSAHSEEHIFIHPSAIVYFGNALGNKELEQTLTITNTSMINLKFRFDLQPADLERYESSGAENVEQLPFTCITFHSERDYLPAYGSTACTIRIRPQTTGEAYYALAMGLIIENVPKCAVRLSESNPHLLILPKSDTSLQSEGQTPVVDVQVALLNALCFVEGVRIIVMPRNIFGSHAHAYATLVNREFKLIVDCNCQDDLEGAWISNLKPRQKVMVYPEKFTIRPRMPKIFDVEYKVESYDDVVEQISVEIENFFSRTIDLKIPIEPPQLKFDRTTLNLGLFLVGRKYQVSFKILNANLVNVDWEVREQFRKDLDRPGSNVIEVRAANMECGDIAITYQITAGEPIVWTSRLNLYTLYAGKKYEDSHLDIHYEITSKPVCVHTDYSQCALLTPDKPLFLHVPATYQLCFHNLTNCETTLAYSHTDGADAQHFDIVSAPKRFVLGAGAIVKVDVTLTSHCAGVHSDIYINFELCDESPFAAIRPDGDEPTPCAAITIAGVLTVNDIYVKVTLPDHRLVFWPPVLETSSSSSEDVDDDASLQKQEFDISSDTFSKFHHESSPKQEDTFQGYAQFDHDLEQDPLESDILNYLKTLSPSGHQESSSALTSTMSTSTFSSDTTITSKSSCQLSDSSETLFKVIARTHEVKICGVPLRTLRKATINLENLTPVKGVIEVDLENFQGQHYEETKMDVILQKLNYKTTQDIWEKKLGPNGIAIEIDSCQELPPFGKQKIDILIYANTWGVYKEHLTLNFNNILALKVMLLVEVVGLPLEFPIGVNNVHKTTILRFGALAYKSNFEWRHLKMRNTSVVPVTVRWHIFMRHTHSEMAQQPISILFDIDDDAPEQDGGGNNGGDLDFDLEPSPRGNLMILHGKCIGTSDHKIFKMHPKETKLHPNENLTLKIGINAHAYAASYAPTQIEAYLIGYVNIPRHSPLAHAQNIHRATGHHMQPIKAKLTATLDLPKLDLEMTSNDLHIPIYADQILKTSSSLTTNTNTNATYCTIVKRHLTFKNRHNLDAAVKFKMDPPFVLETPTSDKNTKSKSNLKISPTNEEDVPWYDVIVQPDMCAQLTVSYAIDAHEINKMAAHLFANDNGGDDDTNDSYDSSIDGAGAMLYSKLNFNTKTFSIVKYLHIEQRGFVRQSIPLSLTIYFPVLHVPEVVDFGNVYIGNVGKNLCVIRNYSVCRVEFTIEESDTFRATTIDGVVKPGRQDVPMIYDLYLVFMPQMQTKFEEYITLRTQIPSLRFRIKCTGTGRQNERFFQPETC